MLLALTTNYDGGALFDKAHTCASSSPSFCIAAELLYQSKHEAGHGPMVHTGDGSASKCLLKMQQNMHELVQLIKAAMLDVPNQTPLLS